MCGIAGIFNSKGLPVDSAALYKMTSAMVRRGPDGDGFHIDANVGLGHRRLAVIDRATGAQPISNEDGTVFLTVCGEIYNFKEVRSNLTAKGHVFKTKTDVECMVHLYEEFGAEFPSYIQGMFAAAIYDSKRKRMILAVDRCGKKPLFYFAENGVVAFASELGALLKHPEAPISLDRQSVWDYFSFGYVPAPDTVFKKIFKLTAGHALEFGLDCPKPHLSCYWKIDYSVKSAMGYEDSVHNLRDLLRDSVERRMVADVPVGVFLSGGIDSAITACLAAETRKNGSLDCFSIGFDDPAYNELEQARANAKFIGEKTGCKINFHARTVSPDDFEALPVLLRHYGQPFGDASLLPMHVLCDFARQSGITVALGGDGADELFAGYERYVAMNLISRLDWIPEKLRNAVFGTLARRLNSSSGERTFSSRLRRFLTAASLDENLRYMSVLSHFPKALKYDVCGPAFMGFTPKRSRRIVQECLENSTAFQNPEPFMETDFHTYLQNDILPKLDSASMTASMELRSPFLDYRVVEAAAGMPIGFKLRGCLRKRILRDAFSECFPESCGRAPKRGFGVPLANWFRGPWKKHLQHYLLEGKMVNRFEIFRRDSVEYLISAHCSGREDFSYPLYELMAFELALPIQD